MIDPKNNQDDVVELDTVADETDQLSLDDLYQDAGTEDYGEFDDGDLQVSESARSGGERFWIVVTVLAFILTVATSLVLPSIVALQADRVEQAANITQKVASTNSAAELSVTSSGNFGSFETQLAQLESSVTRFVQNDSSMHGLAAAVFSNQSSNQQVSLAFADYQTVARRFLNNKDQVTRIRILLAELDASIDDTVNDSVGFVEAVAKEGRSRSNGSTKDKYLFLTTEAANLNGILGRLAGSLDDYFDPRKNLSQVVNEQNGLMVRLQDTLNRIVSNSAAVVGTAAEPLQTKYLDLEAQVTELGERARFLAGSRTALASLRQQGSVLSQSTQAVTVQQPLLNTMSMVAIGLPILFGLFGAFALWRYSRLRKLDLVEHDSDLEDTLADQQESILKLLDEMSALADGDLTVEAEVTDQITGAIADSVNFAVMEMRELVSQINRASIEVANESELAVSNAQSVSKSNMAQAEQISSAATLMQQVSSSMREMTQQANSSSTMAAESINAAEQGTQAVRDTIRGMEDMREQIQDTSKRIKRLGESSQRIGDIVALIDDIAEQTNILSLNAAIQASMAGEAGRGFAVVADEVQGLAERSTEATKKIAELVTTIQNDTNDAVLSMDKATQEVVSGTRVADSAGSALAAIENVSQRLSSLIDGISNESNKQADVVSKVSEEVTQISDSSTETSRKAQDSANSIAKLLELAKDLEASVSRFKLPVN